MKKIIKTRAFFGGFTSGVSSEIQIPEEAENHDLEIMQNMIDSYMNAEYPEFKPEVVYGMDKDYFLPALKVLLRDGDKFYSPSKQVLWEGMELKAECLESPSSVQITGFYIGIPPEILPEIPVEHLYKFPHEGCDCGVYGSVNLEEISAYLLSSQSVLVSAFINRNSIIAAEDAMVMERVLCIIEPSADADVVLHRKGWKAGKAFISEIVGETMPVDAASNLLSLAWHREIDVRRVFHENR